MCDGFSRVCLALIVTKSSTIWRASSESKSTAGTSMVMFSPACDERVQREEPMLAVEHAQDAVLLGNLQQAEVVLAGHRREGEALLGGDDDGAGNRR